MSVKIVKNVDVVEHTWVGCLFKPGQVYYLRQHEYRTWSANASLQQAISAGQAEVHDEIGKVGGPAAQIAHLKSRPNVRRIDDRTVPGSFYYPTQFTLDIPDQLGTHAFKFTPSANFDMLSGHAKTGVVGVGDWMRFVLLKDTPLGNSAFQANLGGNTIELAPQQFDALRVGYLLKVGDDEHEIIGLDRPSRTATVGKVILPDDELAPTWSQDWPAGTALSFSVPFLKNPAISGGGYYLQSNTEYYVGTVAFGPSFVPAGTPITIIYHNTELVAKRLHIQFEAYYS